MAVESISLEDFPSGSGGEARKGFYGHCVALLTQFSDRVLPATDAGPVERECLKRAADAVYAALRAVKKNL